MFPHSRRLGEQPFFASKRVPRASYAAARGNNQFFKDISSTFILICVVPPGLLERSSGELGHLGSVPGRPRSSWNPPQTPSSLDVHRLLMDFRRPLFLSLSLSLFLSLSRSFPPGRRRSSPANFLLYSFPPLPLCKHSGNILPKLRLTNQPFKNRP